VEVATGHRIAAIYGSFDKAMGRIRFARSPGYEIGRGKTPDVEETEQQTERVANAIRRMSHLESEIEALANSFFPGLRHELEVLCLLDELPTAGVMPLVRRALSELAGPLGVRAQMARRKPDSQAERSRM
jgi:hypothetical protein